MKWFRFVPHHLVRDYLDTGWHIVNVDLAHHGEYAALLQWLCDCPLVDPATAGQAQERNLDERHPHVLPVCDSASAHHV